MIRVTVVVEYVDVEPGDEFYTRTVVESVLDDSWKENAEMWPDVVNRAIQGHYGNRPDFEVSLME